jgi:hypothetical protein
VAVRVGRGGISPAGNVARGVGAVGIHTRVNYHLNRSASNRIWRERQNFPSRLFLRLQYLEYPEWRVLGDSSVCDFS